MDNLDYGIIGNCKSAALVSKHGEIVWCCLPNFNSSTVFAKLLDDEIGGSFGFILNEEYEIIQEYLWGTNILSTVFNDGNNAFQLIDFMPRYQREDGSIYAAPDIIRFIRLLKGKPSFKIDFNPKLDFARGTTYSENKGDHIIIITQNGKYDSLYLYSSLDLDKVLQQKEITIEENAYFLLGYHEKLVKQSLDRTYLKFQRTKTYWMNWSEKTTKYEYYNKEILRSAITLKTLTYEKSGAVLAAATTSLPETIGEERNWDYRFCWIRDASMVIKVMAGLGHTKSANDFLQFIINIIPDKNEKIQIMYGINGEKELTEHILTHLKGYKNSTPVRTGNAAYIQKQNDIYGILMQVIYQQFLEFEISLENSEELWTITRGIVKIVEENWKKPDKGIWEHRSEDRHFVFSKLLCWVAVDRAVKIGEVLRRGIKDKKWKQLRSDIYDDIYKNGWNDEIQAYTQYYGSKELDASTLLMEAYGFLDAKDPRFISTVQVTEKELCVDGLMYRYKNKDDFGLPSSSFTICTFWLIDSLYKIGQKKKAKEMFDQLLSYSNHLGLFSEDIDFKTKRLLGNFPQAYSHLALIETAANFSKGIMAQE